MRKEIEQAIKNGLAISPIKIEEKDNLIILSSSYSLHDLVTKTNFIECLEGDELCTNTNCVSNSLAFSDRCKGYFNPRSKCKDYLGAMPLDFHLQQIARSEISRDIKKLIEYVRGLV